MSSILLVKTSSLGDVVHNLPAVSDIRRRLPGAAIDWVAEDAFAEVPRLHAGIRRVIPVAVRRWRRHPFAIDTWRDIRAFRQVLHDSDYDYVIDTQGLLKSALVARMARGRRCGYAAEAAREPLAARFYDDTFAIPRSAHAVERSRWLVAAALGYPPDGPLDYGIATSPLAASWLPAPPYAVLLTATSRADKQWPDAHWLASAAELAARGIAAVLPGGSADERAHAARLARNMRRALAAPALSLAEVARLLAGAAIVVGVDTGLSHLATALGRPVIALFSASDPRLTGVYRDRGAVNLGHAGAAPRPDEVAAAIADLLG